MIIKWLILSALTRLIKCETKTEVKVEELGHFLVELDSKILRLLILPEPGKGDDLLKYLDQFWKNLRYLDGLVVLNDQKAFIPAKFMMEKECPKFVQEAFDVGNIQETYKWRTVKFGNFKEFLMLIAGLTQKFQSDFTKMRVDVDTLFQQPYNNPVQK